MKTIEQRLKEIKRIAIGFFIVGIAMVIFFAVNKGNDKSEDEQNDGYLERQNITAGKYEIDSKGNIISAVKNGYYKEENKEIKSYREIDFKLPYKRNNNALSAKEGVLTHVVHYLSDDRINENDYYPKYSIIEEGVIVLYDPSEQRYGITNGKGNWIVEPCFYEYYKNNDLIVLKRGNDEALVDLKGNWILEPGTFYPYLVVHGSRILFAINSGDYDENGDQIKKIGVCDLSGKTIIEPKYEDVYIDGHNERIWTRDFEGEYRLLDSDGNDILNSGYRYIGGVYKEKDDEYEIYYIIQNANGKFFTFDKDGKEILPPKYDGLTAIENGNVIAEVDGKKGIIDSEGNILLEIEYKDIYKDEGKDIPKGIYKVITMDGKMGIFSLDDAMLMEPQADGTTDKQYHYDYNNNVFYYDRGDGFYVVLRKDKEPLQIECDGLSFTNDGLIMIYDMQDNRARHYLMDMDGNMIYAEGAERIIEGYVDDKLYLIVEEPSDNGNVYKFISDKEVKFECLAKNMKVKPKEMEGIYQVCNDQGLSGVVNCKGELVLGYEYNDIEIINKLDHDDGTYFTVIIVKSIDNKYGIMNDKFEWIYEPQFHSVEAVIGADRFIVWLSNGQVIQK